MSRVRVFGLCAIVLLVPVSVCAHLGLTLEYASGSSFVDLGYDLPLRAEQETLFDATVFHLRDGTVGGQMDFSDVTLHLSSGSLSVKSGPVKKPDFGRPLLLLTPRIQGHWLLTATFRKDGTTISSAEFPIEVLEPDPYMRRGTSVANRVVFASIGIGLLILSALVYKRNS